MMVYFPFFQCSFLPRFSIKIRTKYFNDNGSSQNVCILFLFVLTRYQKKVIGHFQKVYIPYHGRFLYFNPPPPHPPCFWNFQNGLSLHALGIRDWNYCEVKLRVKKAWFSTDNAQTSRLFSFYLISDHKIFISKYFGNAPVDFA